jgi:hypothetical protein
MADLTPLHTMCAMNLAHDLGRRNGVDAILTEFRAARTSSPTG